MAETNDYSPGNWRGYDFNDAKRTYDAHAGRSYAEATTSGKTAMSVVTPRIKATCKRPLIVVVDVTGSMDEWPATIFSKLPYLDKEGQEYLGADLEISFMAVGDATRGDKYPLQVRPFSKDTALVGELKEIVNEHGGGGDQMESYELAALYICRNVDFEYPDAEPVVVFIGDEGVHPHVETGHARNAHIALTSRINTTDVFAELKKKCAVYIVRKSYPNNEANVQAQWEGLLGKDHVAQLEDPNRVVDVIFGLLAKELDMVDYFRQEIEGRQRADQVKTVYTSLKSIHNAWDRVMHGGDDMVSIHDPKPKTPKGKGKGKSVLLAPTDPKAKKSKGLL